MSSVKVTLAESSPQGDVVLKLLDPEIREFEDWFGHKDRGNGPLLRFERDLLRSYLWWATQVEK